MSIIAKLASSLERRDEEPNIQLAKSIAKSKDKKAIDELVALLSDKKTALQNDSIKVLYETGGIKPELIAAYADDFLALLNHKNNRLQWGAMTALYTIAAINPKKIYDSLPKIMHAAEKGSVITRDNAVKILVTLAENKIYRDKIFPLLNEQILSCPENQLPMYAELAMPVIDKKKAVLFVKTLSSRLKDIEKESKRRRVEKVIRKLS
jgi:hypothetical protein